MSRSTKGLLLIVLLGSAASLSAQFSLDFVGLQLNEPVDTYYDGGSGGFGSTGGQNFGISFDLTTANDLYFLCTNTGTTCSASVAGIMDIHNGWDGIMGFYYANDSNARWDVYSGLDGTGTLLSSWSIPPSSPWDVFDLSTGGVAHSIVFNGSLDIAVLGFGEVPIPEPSSLLLLMSGVSGLAYFKYRKA